MRMLELARSSLARRGMARLCTPVLPLGLRLHSEAAILPCSVYHSVLLCRFAGRATWVWYDIVSAAMPYGYNPSSHGQYTCMPIYLAGKVLLTHFVMKHH